MMPTYVLHAAGVCLFASTVIVLPPDAASAQSANLPGTGRGPHVSVELIADRATPGSGMRLGLKFDLEPGWHIYWQNPGDSGGPPEVTWTLPSGMTALGIEWPAPERIDIGGLVNYGYHDTVVLPVPVAVAADARIPPDLVVKASVRWMACANLCVPGKADLALRFPLPAVDQERLSQRRADIDAARTRVPTPAPRSWSASVFATDNTFVVEVLTGTREVHAVFFPLEPSQVNDSAAQAVSPLPSGVRVTLAKSSQFVKNPAVLRGVMTLPDGRSHTIEAPVR